MSELDREKYLEHLRNGMRPGAAAEVLGFERSYAYELIDSDEEFAAQVADAEREATEHVEEALYQAAVSGNVTAAKMWLDLRKKPGTAMVPVGAESDFDRELAELNQIAEGRDGD